MADKFRYMPFHVDDYLSATTDLSPLQHGIYLLLLLRAWKDPDTALPDDDVVLARIAKQPLGTWKQRIRPVLAPFFEIANGRWRQMRQVEVKEHAIEVSAKRAQAVAARQDRTARPPSGRSSDGGPVNPLKTQGPTPTIVSTNVTKDKSLEEKDSESTVVVDSDSRVGGRDDDAIESMVKELYAATGSGTRTITREGIRKQVVGWVDLIGAKLTRVCVNEALEEAVQNPLKIAGMKVTERHALLERGHPILAARPGFARSGITGREDAAQAKAAERARHKQLKDIAKELLKKRGWDNPNADGYDLELSNEIGRLRHVGVGSSTIQ